MKNSVNLFQVILLSLLLSACNDLKTGTSSENKSNYSQNSNDNFTEVAHDQELVVKKVLEKTHNEYGVFLEQYPSEFSGSKGKITFRKQGCCIQLYVTQTKEGITSVKELNILEEELVSVFWKNNPIQQGKMLVVITKTKDFYYTNLIYINKNDFKLYNAQHYFYHDCKNVGEFNKKWKAIPYQEETINFIQNIDCPVEHYTTDNTLSAISREQIENMIIHYYGGGYYRHLESEILYSKNLFACFASSAQGNPDRILFGVNNGYGVEIQTIKLDRNWDASPNPIKLLSIKELNDDLHTVNVRFELNGISASKRFYINCGATGYCTVTSTVF